MAISLAERTLQLQAEERLLVKADQDIAQGSKRILDQEDRIRELTAAGHDCDQAQRLVELFKQTLIEWERHRALIEQRVTYLRHEAAPEPPE